MLSWISFFFLLKLSQRVVWSFDSVYKERKIILGSRLTKEMVSQSREQWPYAIVGMKRDTTDDTSNPFLTQEGCLRLLKVAWQIIFTWQQTRLGLPYWEIWHDRFLASKLFSMPLSHRNSIGFINEKSLLSCNGLFCSVHPDRWCTSLHLTLTAPLQRFHLGLKFRKSAFNS